MKEKFASVRVEMEVSKETISNLFSCAIEGGSTYWCTKIRPLSKDDKRDAEKYMLDGFYIWEEEASQDHGKTKHIVSKDRIIEAVKLMAEQYPNSHFKDALDDSVMDAATGDVFLQLCTFQEVVYG